MKCIVCDVDGGGHMANCPKYAGREIHPGSWQHAVFVLEERIQAMYNLWGTHTHNELLPVADDGTVQARCKFCNATSDLIPVDLEKVATRQFVCSACEWDIDKSSRVFRGTVAAW